MAAIVAGFLACVPLTQALALPRVASLNLCTDQLLLMLAEPGQIVGISPLTRDCWNAVLCEQAQHVPVLRPTAENVVASHPDVVLGGVYTAAVAMQAGREGGAQVIALPPARSLTDIPAQIMVVANAIGVPERGRQLAMAFTTRLASLSVARSSTDPTALSTPPMVLSPMRVRSRMMSLPMLAFAITQRSWDIRHLRAFPWNC